MAVAGSAVAAAVADLRPQRARPDARRFGVLVAQLGLLLMVFRVFHVEGFGATDPDFFPPSSFLLVCCLVFSAFAIHYWLPFHLKERFWITVSVLSLLVFFSLRVALALLGAGAGFYLVLTSRLKYWKRVALVVTAFAAVVLMAHHPGWTRNMMGRFWLPDYFWPVFGTVFLYRTIIYTHDMQQMKSRPPLKDYLAYFFILPNYYFWEFLMIDYKTMQLSYYRRDIHEVAQQGIFWIFRGTLQLLLFRIVCQYRDGLIAGGVTSAVSVLLLILLTVLMYLKVSGPFHISVGMLHLFGYDLPETNHKYLLARNFGDFWRRANIYWKDSMFKVVFLPLYFRLRKKGELRAKMLATGMVFVVSWAIHYYADFWRPGPFQLHWNQVIFWGVLGALVMVNLWRDGNRPKRVAVPTWKTHLRTAASVMGTLAVLFPLWSLYLSPSLSTWLDWITWWKPGF